MRQTDGTNTIDFQYDASGNIIGFIYNGVPYYYLRNLMNDVSGIVDGNGDIVAKYRYDAYGNTILATGTMAAINPIRYRGYYFDAETNWYYLNSRYYSPEWSRFISPDSFFIAGDLITGSNMYAYCNDNPVMYLEFDDSEPINWVQKGFATSNSSRTSDYILNISDVDEIFSKMANHASSWIGKTVMSWAIENFYNSENGIFETISGVMDSLYPDERWQDRKYVGRNTSWMQLRTYFPDMRLLAWPGATFLDFHKITDQSSLNYGNYTTRTDTFQWQKLVGYTWWYDWFFSVGGPTDVRRYEFNGEDGTPYIVWCWKADYWNLGAGAEIGIYYAKDLEHAQKGYYDIDWQNLKVTALMNVTLEKEGESEPVPLTTNFEQTNWWITSFTPDEQKISDINKLHVDLKVKFAGTGERFGLMKPFYNQLYGQNLEGLSWASTENRTQTCENAPHYCNKHPVLCTCSCSCGLPCKYYSDYGNGSESYRGYEGYEFNINF